MSRISGSGCGTCALTIFLMLAMVLFSVGMVLGIIGAASYPNEKRWKENGELAAGGCLVTDWYLLSTICGSKYRYICYYAAWTVNYVTQPDTQNNNQVTNVTTSLYDRRRGSIFYATSRASRYDVGTQDPCYYDSSVLSRVRWEAPNVGPYLGMLIAGWVMFFIGIALGGFMIFMMCS